MLLSRFWYGVMALALGAVTFILSVGAQIYNRTGNRAMSEALSADSSAVEWFLKDEARQRSSALIRVSLNPQLRAALAKASSEAKPTADTREKARKALVGEMDDIPAELKFDSIWAVDAGGRVTAAAGFEHREDWELGGYPLVADALHGWIRDDAWVWKGRIYRVVARPVEQDNGEPVGAVIGAKIVDDTFARAVSKRTGAAVAFYAEGARVASGAPEGFDKSNMDQITQDLKLLDENKDYLEKGRSEVRVIGAHLGVVYTRLPGEAWELGAGYAVGRLAAAIDSPFGFLDKATEEDKAEVPKLLILLGILVVGGLGLGLTFAEYTRPLQVLQIESARLAKGEIDVFAPSRFRGPYRKIAADLNDGIEKVAAKGGAPRRAADLEQVLGPIPVQPAMSAFTVPDAGETTSPSRSSYPRSPVSARSGSSPKRPGSVNPALPSSPGRGSEVDLVEVASEPPPPVSGPPKPPPPRRPAPSGAPAADASAQEGTAVEFVDELTEWNHVYEEFLSVKKQCGESTASLTFEKFKGTLQRNKDALVSRHNCARVRFSVYVKDGKAALKASPVK